MVSRSPVSERTSMKAYLKFAASFWMRAFVTMGSLDGSQNRPTVTPKKNTAASATPVPLL